MNIILARREEATMAADACVLSLLSPSPCPWRKTTTPTLLLLDKEEELEEARGASCCCLSERSGEEKAVATIREGSKGAFLLGCFLMGARESVCFCMRQDHICFFFLIDSALGMHSLLSAENETRASQICSVGSCSLLKI